MPYETLFKSCKLQKHKKNKTNFKFVAYFGKVNNNLMVSKR